MNGQPANSEIEKFVQLSKNEKSVKQKKRYDVVLLYLEGRFHVKFSERVIPTYGKHEGINLVGFLDYGTGASMLKSIKNMTLKCFLAF